jgi:hypothetical protein
MALMLHELESLLGYESTGDYSISAVYLTSTGYTKSLATETTKPANDERQKPGFDFSRYGNLDCDSSVIGDCTIEMRKKSKADCEGVYASVYNALLAAGKSIVRPMTCFQEITVVLARPGGPEEEVPSGYFVGRIFFDR